MNNVGKTLLCLRHSASSTRSAFVSSNNAVCCGVVRWSSRPSFIKKQIRTPIRVYEAGDKVPTAERTRPVIKIPTSETSLEDSAKAIFNTVMGNIHRNKVRKNISLEGTRMIEEALLAGLKLEKLFLLKSLKEVPGKIKSLMNDDVEIHKLGLKHMQVWSSVTTPPGVIGIFLKPKHGEIISRSQDYEESDGRPRIPIPMTVICDNLREPGNLGSLLRSAAGAGCKRVLLSKGCVDAWDGKVLRGGCGAHFRIPITEDIPIHSIGSCIELESPGSESDSEKWSAESQSGPSSIGIFLADSNCNDSRTDLPLVPYSAVDYRQFSQIYLIVGGETEGLGSDTLQITSSLKPSSSSQVPTTVARLHIPLQSQMESLNVAHAFGIIAFEVQRQYSQHHQPNKPLARPE